jgi:histidine triad (HIT) family protein
LDGREPGAGEEIVRARLAAADPRILVELARSKLMPDTIFTKIINKQIPADIVYEDDLCMAVKDINPQAPVHLLLIPKKPIDMLSNAKPDEQSLLGHMLLAVGKITRELKVDGAFRLVINNGKEGGQAVFHLHMHILAGRRFHWPPG